MSEHAAAVEDIYALSPLQRGMLFHRTADPDARAYVVQARMRVEGPVDPERFRMAWQMLLDRHAALRTLFVREGVREPLQIVRPAGSVALRWTYRDWSALDAGALEAELEKFLELDHREPLDLGHAPLFRVALLRTPEPAVHWCIWTHEHLILDGWCLPLLLRELLEIDAALAAGRAPGLPPAVPFRDQVAWLASRRGAAAQRYWRAALAGWSEPTPLPLRRISSRETGAAEPDAEGFAEHRRWLSAGASERLARLCRHSGVTLNTALQGAWAQLLSRMSGEAEVVFGVTVSGREGEREGADSIVGPCINSLPLRVRPAPSERLGDWLRALQRQNLELREHGALGLAEIAQCAGLGRREGHSPLFESLLVFENYPGGAQIAGPGGLCIRPLELAAQSPARSRSAERNNYPLTLVAAPGPQLLLLLAHRRSALREADALRLLGALEEVLRAFAEGGEARLGQLPPHGEPAPERLRAPSRHGAQARRDGFTIGARFAARAAERPHELALVAGGRALRYAELEDRSRALARRLRRALSFAGGEQPRVAVLGERCAESVIAILGALRAGAVYVPLDPEWPVARRESVIADSGARCVLASPVRCAREAQRSAAAWLEVSVDASSGADTAVGGVPGFELPGGALAYLVYTSGSSGRPKGVAVSHAALLDYVDGLHGALRNGRGWRYALASSLATDLGFTSLYGSLCTGGTLHVLPERVALEGEAYAAYHAEHEIDVLKIAPSQLALLLDCARPGAVLPRRRLILGGESVSEAQLCPLAELAERHAPRCQIVNHYGPTEAVVGSLCQRLWPGPPWPARPPAIGIGWPLPRVRCQIADRWGRPLPAGVPGELCVGGPGLALGYWRQPGLTAERFVPDPARPGARLYRTGDRVRRESPGPTFFLGRVDDQLNLGGQRIEPAEVRAALCALPGVRDARVRAVALEGRPQLVAYWIAAAGPEPADEDVLREALGRALPRAMVPVRWVRVERWPLLASGKVDLRALPVPGAAECSPAAPRSALERALAELWAEVLGLEPGRVGIRESFFELGGDSIRCLQVVARARRRGLQLTPRELFDARTVERLAEQLERRAREPGAAAPDGQPATRPSRAPLTPLQRRFFAAPPPRASHWNQALLLCLAPDVTAERLAAALAELERRHDALRLRFGRDARGERFQEVVPPRPVGAVLECVAIGAGGAAEVEAHAARAQEQLDLETGRVFAATWLQRGGGEAGRLLLVAHHLVVDVVSWRILLDELSALLAGERLPDAAPSFLAWARAQAQWAAQPEWGEQREFWLAARGEALPRDLPGALPSRQRDVRGVHRALSPVATRALLEGTAAERASLDDRLLAALGHAVGEVFGLQRIAVECESHGREHPALGPAASEGVGWFTVCYPLGLDLTRRADRARWLAHVRERRRAVPDAGLGWGLLRECGAGDEPLRAVPLPEIRFNNLGHLDLDLDAGAGASAAGLARAPEAVTNLRDPESPRSQLLELSCWVEGGALHFEWAYDRTLHRLETAERLADATGRALESSPGRGPDEPRWLRAADVPLAELGDAELEDLALDARQIEDAYRCAPLQEGLLFHGWLDSSAYVNQLSAELAGVDLSALEGAWRALQQRHAILRSAFAWERPGGAALPWPLQVVWRRAPLPLRVLDWRELGPERERARWEEVLECDRSKGYALREAPLWRVVVARCAQGRARVLWSRHHALLDGWSGTRLLGEWLELYARLRAGEPAALDPAPAYRGYIAWLAQRGREASDRFWAHEFAGISGATPLPLGQPERAARPEGEARGAPAEVSVALAGDSLDALRRAAAAGGWTLSTLCQGAWALLLARASGAREVLFGVTVSGRPAELSGAEAMVGLFINSLPLRVPARPELALGAWLTQLQRRGLELQQHAHGSLARIGARARRAGVRGELFESLVVFENYPLEPLLERDGSALGVRAAESRDGTHYPLALVCVPGRETLRLTVQYAPARYARADAERMAAWTRALLERLAACEPRTRLGSIGLPGAAPQPAVAPASVPVGSHETLVGAFRAQLARGDGAAPALRCGDQTLSYAELDARVRALAAGLRQRGVGSEVRVGLRTGRSPDLVVGALGVLAAGGAYVPIEPGWPASRQRWIARDAGVALVLGEAGDDLGAPAYALAALERAGRAAPEPEPRHSADQLAYVIYTSGSTGEPKGVGVAHRQVLRLLRACQAQFDFSPRDVWTLFHSYAFDFSVWELFGPLCSGGQIELVPADATRDPAALAKLVRERGVSVLSLTPSVFHAVAEALGTQSDALRWIVLGGEALDRRRLAPWFAARGRSGPRLVNMYGITETTVHVTHGEVTAQSCAGGSRGIGRPLADLSVHVLDADQNPLPQGLAGELCIGGAGLARGYLGRPGWTADRFRPDPWGPPGARLYRSGDLGRRNADGELESLGRIDRQLKLRGFRIEPGEIAAALRARPGVRDAVALLRGERLVAYAVPEPGAALDADALRTALRAALPEHMVPGPIALLERFPLTANGKLDEAALPDPGADAAGMLAEPPDALERAVMRIWSELLELPQVAPDDDFFALGGHSLLLVHVQARIRVELGAELGVEDVFEATTPRALAARVRAAPAVAGAES